IGKTCWDTLLRLLVLEEEASQVDDAVGRVCLNDLFRLLLLKEDKKQHADWVLSHHVIRCSNSPTTITSIVIPWLMTLRHNSEYGLWYLAMLFLHLRWFGHVKLRRHGQFAQPCNNVTSGENFAIESQNVSFSVKNEKGNLVPILNNCSLKIPSGQFWMLLGPNGCGKSTLLKDGLEFCVLVIDVMILAGLLSPTDGFMYVRKPRSFVFQNPDHQVVMPTVEADVAFGLGRFNLSNDETKLRVAKALTAVGMYDYLQVTDQHVLSF
ncbi:ABC transporter I family member 10, chloroplastic, partial [Tanacetum coccineum]